tara:strand:- start:322 stop:558 length:237 start_codon:yes stop_codon:yes gene_type:complete
LKQTIKFKIRQDGTVIEEVEGSQGLECLNITRPFEEALGQIISREHKPEYYVTLQQSQDQTNQERTFTTDSNVDGVSS